MRDFFLNSRYLLTRFYKKIFLFEVHLPYALLENVTSRSEIHKNFVPIFTKAVIKVLNFTMNIKFLRTGLPEINPKKPIYWNFHMKWILVEQQYGVKELLEFCEKPLCFWFIPWGSINDVVTSELIRVRKKYFFQFRFKNVYITRHSKVLRLLSGFQSSDKILKCFLASHNHKFARPCPSIETLHHFA